MPFDFKTSSPGDNADISLYPNDERGFRTTVEAFLDVEHDPAEGRHKFGVGVVASRDAISDWVKGSIWFATDVIAGQLVAQVLATEPAPAGWVDVGGISTDLNQTWSKAQWGSYTQDLSATGSIFLDLTDSSYFNLLLTGNITLETPSVMPPVGVGTSFRVRIDNGAGGFTISYSGAWGFPYGIPAPLTGTVGAIDVLYCTVEPDQTITVSAINDVR